MSTETIKTGWLKDKNGDKFAPKTLSSQVQTADGVLLEDKLQDDLNAAKAEILDSIAENIDMSAYETKEDAQDKLAEAKAYTDSKVGTLGTLAKKSTVAKTDLEESVQDSLDKADSALQSYTETDPTVPAWAKEANKPTYTASEVGLGNVNNTSDANKPVSAAQATAIADAKKAGEDAQDAIDAHTGNKSNPHGVTAAQVGAEAKGAVSTHNTATDAHNDIRDLITALTNKLNAFLDVDDTTTDQLSEVLTLIENNKGTLESLTSSKVNVADIINNLTTNVANKPLSAAQGVAIKALIDALSDVVETKASASDLTTHTGNKNNPHGVSLTQLGVTVSADEINCVDGVTSNIQTQINTLSSGVAYINESSNENVEDPNAVPRVTVDSEFLQYSTNPVENQVVTAKFNTVDGAIGALQSQMSALSTETWTFTLEDGSTVTKAVYVG